MYMIYKKMSFPAASVCCTYIVFGPSVEKAVVTSIVSDAESTV